jgi:hypothetical protein
MTCTRVHLSMYGNIVTPPLWPTFILHHIAKSHAVIGLPNNEWSDQAFAFKGDLVHGQLPSIYWDPLHLNHQVPGQQRVQISDAPTQLLRNPNTCLFGIWTFH